MDGAGQIGIGLNWGQGITFQAVWEGGALGYLVSNERDEDVELEFAAAECNDTGPSAGCTYGEAIASWQFPGRTLRKITGAEAAQLSAASGLIHARANTSTLGLLYFPELAPQPSERAVVSNAGINTTSGIGHVPGQVETDFLVAPASAFSVDLVALAPGEILLFSNAEPAAGVSYVDILGATSNEATVQPTDSGFRIAIPSSASAESPVRIAVDVQIPAGFSGKVIGFDSWFCTEMVSGECAAGHRLSRAIPVEAPVP